MIPRSAFVFFVCRQFGKKDVLTDLDLTMEIPLVFHQYDFQLRVAQHAVSLSRKKKFKLRCAMFPREQVDVSIEMPANDCIPPSGK